MAKVLRIKDGESFEVWPGEIFRFGCCECGLTHDMVAVIEESGNLGIALRQNKRATAARRRWIKRA